MTTDTAQATDGPLDRIVVAVVGAILLGLFIAGLRFMAGSWSRLSASVIAIAVYMAGVAVAALCVRRLTPNWRPWGAAARLLYPVSGAGAGWVYARLAGSTNMESFIVQAVVIASLHALLMYRDLRALNRRG
ncbi:MAG: hypothetical protein NVS9B3_16600 [Gemmatimonadaceae bacterium]